MRDEVCSICAYKWSMIYKSAQYVRNCVVDQKNHDYTEDMKRVIVHSDINHCYAQIEEMRHPELRNVPMAVGGSEEKRHGIILAKNDLAKAANIKTGESLRDAYRKCPNLTIVHPDYDAYMYYTEKIKDIYRKYTDRVESFGLDEAWIDLTPSQKLFGDGVELAKKIQDEVYDTYGMTVSMGVSFNKVFAKLGSDLFKHKGFALIQEEDVENIVWPLPVEDLLMVGTRMKKHLNEMGIFTIGDLAHRSVHELEKRFGVMGHLLWMYANGLDDSEVHEVGYTRPAKSISHSKTVVKDIESMAQLREVFRVLSECVAADLRKAHVKGRTIHIHLRGSDLKSCGKQKKFDQYTDLASDILSAAMDLAAKLWVGDVPLRSVGIHVSMLSATQNFDQLDLFSQPQTREKERALEEVLYKIRNRYGYDSCRMAASRVDAQLTDFDPDGLLHQVHPVGVLEGSIRK